LTAKLGGEARGVPVLPGLDEAAVLDPNDGSPGDVSRFARGGVLHLRKPVDAGEIALCQDQNRRDFYFRELRAQAVVEVFELGGATNHCRAIVEHTVWREKLSDDVAVAPVPNFFKPADREPLILIEGGDCWGGGHEGTS